MKKLLLTFLFSIICMSLQNGPLIADNRQKINFITHIQDIYKHYQKCKNGACTPQEKKQLKEELRDLRTTALFASCGIAGVLTGSIAITFLIDDISNHIRHNEVSKEMNSLQAKLDQNKKEYDENTHIAQEKLKQQEQAQQQATLQKQQKDLEIQKKEIQDGLVNDLVEPEKKLVEIEAKVILLTEECQRKEKEEKIKAEERELKAQRLANLFNKSAEILAALEEQKSAMSQKTENLTA